MSQIAVIPAASTRKIIREMDAEEVFALAKRLFKKIQDESMTTAEFADFTECRAQYRQLTDRTLTFDMLKPLTCIECREEITELFHGHPLCKSCGTPHYL